MMQLSLSIGVISLLYFDTFTNIKIFNINPIQSYNLPIFFYFYGFEIIKAFLQMEIAMKYHDWFILVAFIRELAIPPSPKTFLTPFQVSVKTSSTIDYKFLSPINVEIASNLKCPVDIVCFRVNLHCSGMKWKRIFLNVNCR